MSLINIFKSEIDLTQYPMNKFDYVDVEKYLGKDTVEYKRTIAVAAQMQSLLEQKNIDPEYKEDLLTIAFLHDITKSKLIKRRTFPALDSAIFAKEIDMPDRIALALMFHTASEDMATEKGKWIAKIYKHSKSLIKEHPEVKDYIDLLTYCNLTVNDDATVTNAKRRIFKLLHKLKEGPEHKVLMKNKRKFLRLEKNILSSRFKKEYINETQDTGFEG